MFSFIQIRYYVTKANSLVRFVKRNLKASNRNTTEDNAYIELVRRHVEYRLPIFSPFTIDTN